MRVLALVVFGAVAFVGAFWLFFHEGEEIVDFVVDSADRMRVPVQKSLGHQPRATKLIYLNREGAALVPGPDDARKNRSSVLQQRGLTTHAVDAFSGSASNFEKIASCVAENFEAYDVEVVTRRPVDRDYMMVMIGGRPGPLKDADAHRGMRLHGLAPSAGGPVERAIVYVFSRELGNNVRKVCETVSHEIAHAYGLDHTRHCSDLMSYKKPCRRRRVFADKDMACGEGADRSCDSGLATQNSHAMLLRALGPRAAAPAE